MAEAYAVSYDLRLFLGAPSDFLGLRVGLAFAFAAFFALAGSGLEDSLALAGSGLGTGGTSPAMVGMPRRRAACASTTGAAAGRLSAARAAAGVSAASFAASLSS